MRLIDADELMELVWRDKIDSRELIAERIKNAPTVEQEPRVKCIAKVEFDKGQMEEIVHELLKEYIGTKAKALEEIEREIRVWQRDVHDNEDDADEFDFVFDRIYEILAEHRKVEE